MDTREQVRQQKLSRGQGISALVVFYIAIIAGLLGSAAAIL